MTPVASRFVKRCSPLHRDGGSRRRTLIWAEKRAIVGSSERPNVMESPFTLLSSDIPRVLPIAPPIEANV